MIGALLANDPTQTEKILVNELSHVGALPMGAVPSAFFWYHHCGYREVWNNASWNDPSMHRTMDEYIEEAVRKGRWQEKAPLAPDKPPRVLFEIGGNLLRWQRGSR
jgi:hypothetical protein